MQRYPHGYYTLTRYLLPHVQIKYTLPLNAKAIPIFILPDCGKRPIWPYEHIEIQEVYSLLGVYAGRGLQPEAADNRRHPSPFKSIVK